MNKYKKNSKEIRPKIMKVTFSGNIRLVDNPKYKKEAEK